MILARDIGGTKTVLAIYAGSIPPRILKRLARPDFLGRIADKGRFF